MNHIDIGTIGRSNHGPNDKIVKAMHGDYLWVKDMQGNTMTTCHKTEFVVSPPRPRAVMATAHDWESNAHSDPFPAIELTNQVRAVLLAAGMSVPISPIR